jgi:hypothetical protein
MRKLFDQITPAQRATLEQGWTEMRARLDEMEKGEKRNEIEGLLKDERDAQVRDHDAAMKAFEQTYPADPRALVAMRLRHFLDVTRDVNFAAQLVAAETAPRLVQLRVLGGFAAIALLLAAVGIHSLLGFTVSSRTREIGVRLALGATAPDIMWTVIGRSTALAVVGVAVGAVLAYAAGRSMQSLLFGINPADATVFGAAIIVALLMAIAGSLMPAWRAVRIDPLTATRTE